MAVDHDRSGEVLAGRYRLFNQIGSGGMGTVYAAEHLDVGRKVAIKILRAEASGRPALVERFRREARAAGTIDHENIVDCLDSGTTPDGLLFYVMEWLKGEDLLSVLRRERILPWPRARAILAQLCRALAAAHAHGIAHRDLKPSNLFLIHRGSNHDFLKLLDFGIAKLLDEEPGNEGITKFGEVVGTTPYMAPELAAGEPVDHRIDVYATGIVLCQVLTGHLPFHGKGPRQILAAILQGNPPRLHELNPQIAASPALDALVQRALHRDRDQRFPDMAALHDALLELPDDACTRLYTAPYAAVAASVPNPATDADVTVDFGSHVAADASHHGTAVTTARAARSGKFTAEPALPVLPLSRTPQPPVAAAAPVKPTALNLPTQPAPPRRNALVPVLLLLLFAAGVAAWVVLYGVPEFLRAPAPPVT